MLHDLRHSLRVFARLQPGASLANAQADVNPNSAAGYPEP